MRDAEIQEIRRNAAKKKLAIWEAMLLFGACAAVGAIIPAVALSMLTQSAWIGFTTWVIAIVITTIVGRAVGRVDWESKH